MAAATQLREFRDQSVTNVWTVPAFSDLALNGTTIKGGDLVQVLATGQFYICTGPESYILLGSAGFQQASKVFNASLTNLLGKAAADTDTDEFLAASGVRVHGQGIAETDSGLTVANGLDGPIGSLFTTDEIAHVAALSFGGDTEMWTPAANGPFHVKAKVAMSSAITDRAMFLGFIGASAAALDPAVTGDTVTLTLVQDDVHGLIFDSDLTDADRLYFAANKANGAASELVTADGVDTGVDFPAAGTYVDLQVTVEANGTTKAYVNGVLVSTRVGAASTTVALNPVLYVDANAAAVTTMLVKQFTAWSDA